ncbi:type 4a pilus biogenesis protein PilO [Natranaerobius thermophilus]|uniref:Type IV pilus assembly protein PilO n=1 Tax=Natranaerobius thermophilus (strain ATCC BAA-1301 / DSM 18059 / JW/NM-WN-LF) TaxID=457570 RepID=B2A7F6_NATTJ|nr:type II secretion system protein GspM [Natranaerobius thermophilus]ACB85665.1 hypothetical protein Nther_2098 [Natranaerobius thermophilus JW/NM-WN-LF]
MDEKNKGLINKLSSLSKRERLLLMIAGILVVFVSFWQFIFIPFENRRSELEKNIDHTQQNINHLQGKLSEWADFEEGMTDPKQQIGELEEILPGTIEREYVFYEIATIFYQQNISFDTIFFNSQEMDEGIKKLNMSGNLWGRYSDVYQTMEQLEDMERLVNVTSLDITSLEDTYSENEHGLEQDIDSQEINVAFEIEVYWDDIPLNRTKNTLDPEKDDMGKLDPFIRVQD